MTVLDMHFHALVSRKVSPSTSSSRLPFLNAFEANHAQLLLVHVL